MDIRIQEEPGRTEIQVVITCGQADGQVMKLLAAIRAMDQKLTGMQEGQTFLLDFSEVLYIDTVDKKTFLYTADGVFETPLRLYELEERLCAHGFFRISKSAIVNFNAIQSLRPDLGGRLRLTLRSGEAVYASRQYAPVIKQKIGIN